MTQTRPHARISKLETSAAVELAAPERVVGIADISHPLAVAREIHVTGGDAPEIRSEITRLRVVADQLGALLDADHEQSLAVLAGKRAAELQRSRGQLDRLPRYFPPPIGLIGNDPDVGGAIARALKDIKSAVGRPLAAALIGGIVPAGQQRVRVAAVGTHFPEFGGTVDDVRNRESNAGAVG